MMGGIDAELTGTHGREGGNAGCSCGDTPAWLSLLIFARRRDGTTSHTNLRRTKKKRRTGTVPNPQQLDGPLRGPSGYHNVPERTDAADSD